MKWREEAMEKLRQYDAMRHALRNIPAEISRLKMDARNLRSAFGENTPVRSGGSRREDAMINNLAQRQELEWTLQQVKRWLQVTERGLSALPEDERLVLQRMYIYPERGATERLCAELGLEQSSVYRKRDQALYRFTTALYGLQES